MNTKFSFILLISLFSFIFMPDLFAQEFTFAAMSDSRGEDRGSNEIVLSALVNILLPVKKKLNF